MDQESYRREFFAEPEPRSRFDLVGVRGLTVVVGDFALAVAFYERVFGPPAYLEGADTRGWRLGDGWLTLLHDPSAGTGKAEVTLAMKTPAEAERLRQAFLAAGGQAPEPTDQLMYEPVRFCPVSDPFGTRFLIVAPLSRSGSGD